MSEIERVKNCAQCRCEFRERANFGRLMCRIHPDFTPTDSFHRLKCCGYRPGDAAAAYSKTVTLADQSGCLPCDHSADTPISTSPVVIMACLLVESRLILNPMAAQIVECIDGERLRQHIKRGGPDVRLTVALPPPLAWTELGLVACAFQVLGEFVQSPYYDWSQFNGVKEARTRFEAASAHLVVSTGWDTEFDMRPDHDAFAGNAAASDDDDDENAKGPGRSDTAYTPADRLALNSPETRFAVVQKVRQTNDLKCLCDMAVPFYVIRRVAERKDRETLAHFERYNQSDALTWETAMRNTRFSSANEYTPVTNNTDK